MPVVDRHVDVLILGAGISGIGMACHLVRECPERSFAVLEQRDTIGGTWDLFRYPGVRSDSDMFTFGFNFRPWNDTKVLADGASILEYVRDTADEYGVLEQIRFGREVVTASWSSADARWTVEARTANGSETATETWTAGYLVAGTGYYDYDHPFRPEFPGEADFGGRLVHPQHWPDDLDVQGKKVVIVGSGATAVTLVPALAPDAARVTMLQRSPSYIVSLPAVDKVSGGLRRLLPAAVVYKTARARNIAVQRATYALAKSSPGLVRKLIVKGVERQLHGACDIANFTPDYEPWDQRLCVVPDGDLFRALRSGKAEVVTDRIESFTASGIRLASGRELEADIVVTATGLNVRMLGGATLQVDGEPVALADRVTYKGVLLEGVPNASLVFGYINASWTLKADLAAEYTCRLLNHMTEHGHATAVVHATAADRAETSVMSALNSGYVRRGDHALPRQGTTGPWRVSNDYLRDVPMLRRGAIDDGVVEFGAAPTTTPETPTQRRVAPRRASA